MVTATPTKDYLKKTDTSLKTPNFFIVGSLKSGTTSLYQYLQQHPDIYMSPIKEPNFFCTDIHKNEFPKEYIQSLNSDLENFLKTDMKKEGPQFLYFKNPDDYKKLFKHAGDQKIRGEASTSYLYSSEAAKNIYQKNKDAKIVMFLRNPVSRVYSHYQMDLRSGYTKDDFITAVKKDVAKKEKGWGVSSLYVETGLYYEQVKRYLTIFPAEQVKIFLYDDLKNDMPGTLKELFRFLEVDDEIDIDTSKRYNESLAPRNRFLSVITHKTKAIHGFVDSMGSSFKKNIKKFLFTNVNNPHTLRSEERKYIYTLFEKDIENLSKLIDRDLSLWQV